MKCLSPMSIARPNGSGAKDRITIPCGICFACLAKKRAEWFFRLKNELKDHTSALFVTLTYSDEKIPKQNGLYTVRKKDCQDFLKRLRDRIKPRKIRYYLVSEYGTETLRPHYHAIIFNMDLDDLAIIDKAWQFGHISIVSVTDASMNYVCKYVINKQVVIKGVEKVFSIMSLRPAIGKTYLELNEQYHIENSIFYGTLEGGKKVSLPRYYRDKIFSKFDKEANNLYMQMLEDQAIARDMEKHWDYFAQDLNKKIQFTEKQLS